MLPDEETLGSAPVLRQPLIMVIDDSKVVREVVEASFKRIGLEAISFRDGLSAITALAKGQVAVPDLVLLDIGMPKMDGYEVARILRSNPDFSQTKLIMLTGRSHVFDRMKAMMVGAQDFITKPFRSSELIEKVCAHLHMPVPRRTLPDGSGTQM